MRPNIPPKEFAKWLKTLPEDERRFGNEMEFEQAEKDYIKFKEAIENGMCSLCGKHLQAFNQSAPCLHWLLRPRKFKKKHFPLLYEEFGYFRVAGYVRWVASTEKSFQNINDILEEHSEEKIIDFTAKYKHITWSFSCSKSDLEGHKNSRYGDMPHYHIKMTLQGQRFINYSDFHVPFNSDDLFDLELFTNHKDIARFSWGRGSGMQELFKDEETMEYIVDESIGTTDSENSTFNLDTLIMAPEGETLSGDVLYEAFEESKKTGKTATSILKEKLKDSGVGITTMVSAGSAVPEAQSRTGRKKKR